MADNVNHPSHYTSHPSGIECIEVTRHYCFSIGNAIKYLWRAGLKKEQGLEDRQKEIEDLRKDQGNVYSIRIDEKLDSDGALVYNGEKDDRKRLILIKLKKRAMSVVSHELKHAYQYYKGQLGFILDQSGKQVGNNNCKTFEREAFTRGNMFEDALLIEGSLSLRIYNLDPGKYIFQHGTKYENYPEDSGISLPSGYTFVSNHKYCFF
jgi:hypothetical protein